MKLKKHFALLAGLGFLLPSRVFATETWAPLITAEHFTGIKADTLLAVGGILTIILIIAGLGILMRVLR
jgi:hypothetical protein